MMLPAISLLFVIGAVNACTPRNFEDGTVCVCTADDCDSIPGVNGLNDDAIRVLYTSSSDPGINSRDVNFVNHVDEAAIKITVSDDVVYQKMVGFGGAFTDSTSSNILKLSPELQQQLLSSYFADDGIEYNICRVPIGACDFSPRLYTLDDDHEGDVNLQYFALADEDLNYKIPVIKQSLELRGEKPLNLFASAWTAPLWMKNEKVWRGGSMLLPEYYQTWADYHLKFFDGYRQQGIEFWGLTVGNEPNTGYMKWTQIPSMGWSTTQQAKYIKQNLGPSVRNSTFSHLKIIIHDEILSIVPYLVPPLLEDEEVLKYIDGVGVHWYTDGDFDPNIRLLAHSDKEGFFVINSETCHFYTAPKLGSWPRAVDYIDDIMTDIEYGYGGWVEWNLLLDTSGGPTQINGPADAPIIMSDDLTELYRQPTFYILGHFSKYVLPDSVRIDAQTTGNVRVLAFLRPDNVKVLTVYNGGDNPEVIQVNDGPKISSSIEVPAHSLNTILYKS